MLVYYKLISQINTKNVSQVKEKVNAMKNAMKRKSSVLEEAESCRRVRGSFGRNMNWPWSSALNGLWNSQVSAAGKPPLSGMSAFLIKNF